MRVCACKPISTANSMPAPCWRWNATLRIARIAPRLLADLEATRQLMRRDAPYYRADAALREKIVSNLAPESGSGAARHSASAFPAGSSPARPAAWVPRCSRRSWSFFLAVPRPDPLAADLMNAHFALLDVGPSDRCRVERPAYGQALVRRPYDVSPPANDFAKDGYTLAGGRADYVDGHRAAVVVYRHGAHIINVFCLGRGRRQTASRYDATGLSYFLLAQCRSCLLRCLRHRARRTGGAGASAETAIDAPAGNTAGINTPPVAVCPLETNREAHMPQDKESTGRRRGALKCLAFGGAGTLFVLSGGHPDAHRPRRCRHPALPHNRQPSFLQISDTHIGFTRKPIRMSPARLKQTIAYVNAMPVRPALTLPHRGHFASFQAGRVRRPPLSFYPA